MRKTLLVSAALAFLAGACASEKKERVTAPAAQATSAVPAPAPVATQPVTVVGENYCLGCSLKKEQGAAAQCSIYGHRHALKVESASGADGKSIEALVGDSLHYLDNDKSATLIKGEDFHKKRVEVKGKLFGPERTLDVAEVKAL